MALGTDSRYREGVARALFGASLLLFAVFLGIMFLATALLGPPGILGALALFASVPLGLLGILLAGDGYARMSRAHG